MAHDLACVFACYKTCSVTPALPRMTLGAVPQYHCTRMCSAVGCALCSCAALCCLLCMHCLCMCVCCCTVRPAALTALPSVCCVGVGMGHGARRAVYLKGWRPLCGEDGGNSSSCRTHSLACLVVFICVLRSVTRCVLQQRACAWRGMAWRGEVSHMLLGCSAMVLSCAHVASNSSVLLQQPFLSECLRSTVARMGPLLG